MSTKNSFANQTLSPIRENETSISKTNQTISVQRISARLSRVIDKFSSFSIVKAYSQNKQISTSTLEEKFKFIELVGEKLNENISNTKNSSNSSASDIVLSIEKQLFNNTSFENEDLPSRISRIGCFQESNFKAIKGQINNLVSDPNIPLDIIRQLLQNILNNMNKVPIPNRDIENIETLKNITKIAYSPQSSIDLLRDSLKKSLNLQQNSQVKIQELQRKAKYLEDQIHFAYQAPQKSNNSDDDDESIFSDNSKLRAFGSSPNRNMRQSPRIQLTSYSSSASPRKTRTFGLDDDDCEMDSFALREAFEPEIKDQYQDRLEQMNAKMRSQGMSMRDIESANEVFKDCFIDLRSKILVQQDQISSLEREQKNISALREKLTQQEASIRKLQQTLKDSIKENPEYKKQLKTIQLLTAKLNQAMNKIVLNQEKMQKVTSLLQEKEDQRKRAQTESNNLKKELDSIQKAFENSAIDAENLKSLEIKNKGIKGLLEQLKKTEMLCESQQEKLFHMQNYINKLKEKLTQNGITVPESEIPETKFAFQLNAMKKKIKESASYTASFNDSSIIIDDDNTSACSQNNQISNSSDKSAQNSESLSAGGNQIGGTNSASGLSENQNGEIKNSAFMNGSQNGGINGSNSNGMFLSASQNGGEFNGSSKSNGMFLSSEQSNSNSNGMLLNGNQNGGEFSGNSNSNGMLLSGGQNIAGSSGMFCAGNPSGNVINGSNTNGFMNNGQSGESVNSNGVHSNENPAGGQFGSQILDRNVSLQQNMISNGADLKEEIETLKIKCSAQDTEIATLKTENEALQKELSTAKEEEKKRYEEEIRLLSDHVKELENDKKELITISIKQSAQIGKVESKFSQFQSEAETRLNTIIKKVVQIDNGFKEFNSVHAGHGNSSPRDRKTIGELSHLLSVANNTIATLSSEKDSLLGILYSETPNSKASGKIDNENNDATQKLQMNLQQIDEQVTCRIDDVKNAKSVILNENPKV